MKQSDPIKVYDARWERGEFSEAQIKRLFEASFIYGKELGVDTVFFSRDARFGCAEVIQWGIDSAKKANFEVYICPNSISTPQSYFATAKITLDHPGTMGFAVTASHNPANYIGIKMTTPGIRAIGLDSGPLGGLKRIREIYHSDLHLSETGRNAKLHLVDFQNTFIDESLKAAAVAPGSLFGIKVVLDSMNGSGGAETYSALQKAGVDVTPVNLLPDGFFPNGSPNPTSIGKMDKNIKLASEIQADAVIGLDGDGDRIVFGTPKGLLSAGFAMIQVLHGINRGSLGQIQIIADPKINPVALSEWRKLDAMPILFRNGHSQIKDYMKQIGAVLAVEESGHFYHLMHLDTLSYFAENQLLTILLFLKVCKNNKELSKNIIGQQAAVHSTGEINYQFENDQIRDEALNSAVNLFKHIGARIITHSKDGIDLEGIMILYGIDSNTFLLESEDNWLSGYFRIATNEKSVARFYLSAANLENCRIHENDIRKLLENTYHGIIVD